MNAWHEKTEVPRVKFVEWLGIARAKFYEWRRRYGKANEHNAKIPRDHWIERMRSVYRVVTASTPSSYQVARRFDVERR